MIAGRATALLPHIFWHSARSEALRVVSDLTVGEPRMHYDQTASSKATGR